MTTNQKTNMQNRRRFRPNVENMPIRLAPSGAGLAAIVIDDPLPEPEPPPPPLDPPIPYPPVPPSGPVGPGIPMVVAHPMDTSGTGTSSLIVIAPLPPNPPNALLC
jgi:hypothetical protein